MADLCLIKGKSSRVSLKRQRPRTGLVSEAACANLSIFGESGYIYERVYGPDALDVGGPSAGLGERGRISGSLCRMAAALETRRLEKVGQSVEASG